MYLFFLIYGFSCRKNSRTGMVCHAKRSRITDHNFDYYLDINCMINECKM